MSASLPRPTKASCEPAVAQKRGNRLKKTHMRVLTLALIGTFALAAAPAPASVSGLGGRSLEQQIREHRTDVWKWQRVMGERPAPTRYGERRASPERLVQLRDAWKGRANLARTEARRPPNHEAWLCIHQYEGSWSDPGAPYYGGLQMDIGFQETYGPSLLQRKGTADNWTPLEQMWVAERALQSGRGFYPWPNAARLCGLI